MGRLCSLLLLFPLLLTAQPAAPPPAPKAAQMTEAEAENLDILQSLVIAMTTLRAQIETQTQKLKAGENDALKKEIADLQARLAQDEKDFETVATGSISPDVEAHPADNTKLDIAGELNELVEPLVRALKSATEKPRMIERLRSDLSAQEKRVALIEKAVQNIEGALKVLPKPKDPTPADISLRKSLQTTLERWRTRQREAADGVDVMRSRLRDNEAKLDSLWQILSGEVTTFFLTRGRNIALAVLAFIGAFLGWRVFQRWLMRKLPWSPNDPNRPLLARLLEVAFHVLGFVMAAVAMMTVMYWTNDWLLIGLSIIAMLALLLAAKEGLPKYYRQARLLMNLGEVREGERLIMGGIPWQVRSINMFSELVNPALQNGTLRLPITQLVGMTSHQHLQGDPWFPCAQDDWVMMGDGTLGKAVTMTPDFVQLVQLGGAYRTFTTQQFVQSSPVSLSNGFRVMTMVRIDKLHQESADETIPAALREGIHEGLLALAEPDQIKSLKVEYRGTPDKAMEFDVIADFDGAVADKYGTLQRTIQTSALRVCTARGWKLGAS